MPASAAALARAISRPIPDSAPDHEKLAAKHGCSAPLTNQKLLSWQYDIDDVDLEKFFDRVNHNILIDRLLKRIEGAGIIRLIRAYLNSGIISDGVVPERHQGKPQGGPLSPFLANVMLDEVDKKLARRGHYSWTTISAVSTRFPSPFSECAAAALRTKASIHAGFRILV